MHRTTYHVRARALFLGMESEGPWLCTFCGELVRWRGGTNASALVVHHLDEDPSNNDLDNLAAAHGGCHSAHHHRRPEQ